MEVDEESGKRNKRVTYSLSCLVSEPVGTWHVLALRMCVCASVGVSFGYLLVSYFGNTASSCKGIPI